MNALAAPQGSRNIAGELAEREEDAKRRMAAVVAAKFGQVASSTFMGLDLSLGSPLGVHTALDKRGDHLLIVRVRLVKSDRLAGYEAYISDSRLVPLRSCSLRWSGASGVYLHVNEPGHINNDGKPFSVYLAAEAGDWLLNALAG